MAGNNDFADRLKRIEQNHAANAPDDRLPPPSERNARGGPRPKLFNFGYIVVAAIVGGYLVLVLTFKGWGEAIALTVSPEPHQNVTTDDRGIMKTMSRKLVMGAQKFPIDFVPPAPPGWVRVTAADAGNPEIRSQIEAGWPKDGPTLEQNLGFKHLKQFASSYRRPDIETRHWEKRNTKAMYLHPKGHFFVLRLSRLSSKSALGQEDWISELMRRNTDKLDRDEEFEVVTLAGLPAVNRAKSVGKSLFSRPIGTHFDVPNAMRVMVPFGSHATADIVGLGTPNELGAILSGMNPQGFAAWAAQ